MNCMGDTRQRLAGIKPGCSSFNLRIWQLLAGRSDYPELDCGCGTGNKMCFLSRFGYKEPSGIELDKE